MLPSLLSQIVSELASSYPQASSEDIANSLIDSVETEILPYAVKAMTLPPPPSKMQILLERKREERRKKKYRTSILEHKMELAENLEYVKYKLGGEETNRTSLKPVPIEGDLDDLAMHIHIPPGASSVKEYFEKRDGVPLPKGSGFSRFGRRLEVEKSYPYVKGIFERETEVRFFFDDEIQNRLLPDSLFMNIISSIEVFLRNFAKPHPEASFSVSIKCDSQIPTWEKVIVKLTIPDLSFDQKMRIWDSVDMELRKALREVAARGNKASRIAETENIIKRLFTHVDL